MKRVSSKKLIKINLFVLILCCLSYNLVLFNYYGITSNTKVEAKIKEDFIPATGDLTVVYEGMTLNELGSKLERSLKNELKGYGIVYATYAIEYGVDPYIALGISLYETGCSGNGCSIAAKYCNNVGGMVKGSSSCSRSRFAGFETLDEGIELHIKNIVKNYYNYGLYTVEEMQNRYAGGSSTWAAQVNSIIKKIKNA